MISAKDMQIPKVGACLECCQSADRLGGWRTREGNHCSTFFVIRYPVRFSLGGLLMKNLSLSCLGVSVRVLLIALVAAVSMVGCNKTRDAAASKPVAKVNAGEVSVAQLDSALKNAKFDSPEPSRQDRPQVLSRLIEQELLVQKAKEGKLDSDPQVVQALEAARREVLARAYMDKVLAAVGKPGEKELKSYYDKHPELFSERRIYSLREVLIANAPGLAARVSEKVAKIKSLEELVVWLKSEKIRYAANAVVKPAEQLPHEALGRFFAMKDGEVKVLDTPRAVVVLQRVNSRLEPIDEARARPAIEQFLGNEQRRQVSAAEIKRLKAAAKIEYLGEFAKLGSSASAPVASGKAPK